MVYLISFIFIWNSINVDPLKKVLHTLCSLASKPCMQPLHTAHTASQPIHLREICYPPEHNRNFSVSYDFSPSNPTRRLYFVHKKIIYTKQSYFFPKDSVYRCASQYHLIAKFDCRLLTNSAINYAKALQRFRRNFLPPSSVYNWYKLFTIMFNAGCSIKSLIITGQIHETDIAKMPCSGAKLFVPSDVNKLTNSLE